jgi:hypothetical protein
VKRYLGKNEHAGLVACDLDPTALVLEEELFWVEIFKVGELVGELFVPHAVDEAGGCVLITSANNHVQLGSKAVDFVLRVQFKDEPIAAVLRKRWFNRLTVSYNKPLNLHNQYGLPINRALQRSLLLHIPQRRSWRPCTIQHTRPPIFKFLSHFRPPLILYRSKAPCRVTRRVSYRRRCDLGKLVFEIRIGNFEL